MNERTLKMLANGMLCLVMMTLGGEGAFGAMHDDGACVADEVTMQQLKSARSQTARFHSIEAAEAAGYTNINLPVPNMGEHWVNFALVDNVFEPDRPEALVYADFGTGNLQLVAVEYLAPLSSEPPAGFSGTCDAWSPFGGQLWTLHAWIWQPNLSGTFAKFNPLVP